MDMRDMPCMPRGVGRIIERGVTLVSTRAKRARNFRPRPFRILFSDTVTHLGHVLHCSLDDGPDIKRATLEMCKKANVVLSTFSACDPHVKTVLFSSHCLSLYGGVLWDISCNQIKSLEVAFNNILRSYPEIAIPVYSIKLHVLTVFLIGL